MSMNAQYPRKQGNASEEKKRRKGTPTFQVEPPVEVAQGQARTLQVHFDVGRQLNNAILSLGQQRLKRMRADPTCQQVKTIPRTHKAERSAASVALHKQHGFSEYTLQEAAKDLRTGWLAEHIEAVVMPDVGERRQPR